MDLSEGLTRLWCGRCLRHRLHHVCPLFSNLNMWLNYNSEIYRWSRSWSVSDGLLTNWLGAHELTKHQICSNTGSSLFPCRMDFYQTHLWQIEFDSKRWPWWRSRCVQSSIRHIFIHVSQWFVYNTDITVRQVYFFTVRLLNLSRFLCFLFRVLCSSDGGLPFGRCHRWIHLGRTGCPCLRYVQIASCLISEMCDMFFSLALHFPCEFVWTLSS